jgi:hypothetical protein
VKRAIAVAGLFVGGVASVAIAISVADGRLGAIGVVIFGLGVLVSSENW